MSHPYPPPGQPDPHQPGWPDQGGAQGQQYPAAYPGSPVVDPGSYPPGGYSAQPVSGQPGTYPQQGGYSAQPVSGQPGTYPQQGGYPAQPASGQYGSYPPAGGYPGSPVSGQPGTYPQPGGYPGTPGTTGAFGQPGGYPLGGYPVPPNKSNRGLIIGVAAAGVVVLLLVIGTAVALLLPNDEDDPAPPITQPTTAPSSPAAGGAPEPEPTRSPEPVPNNNGVTATYSSDFETVCEGGSIVNAAEYVPGGDTKAFAFSNSPDRTTNWVSRSMSSDDPWYAKSSEFEKVSVVGCLSYVEGSEGTPKSCNYKDRDGKQVTVSYISSRFELVFYAAKTGKKIGDGGNVNAPATRCPSFITYNTQTLKSYASPDTGALRAAFEKFLS